MHTISDQLSDKIMELFDKVIEEREKHFAADDIETPDSKQAKKIIDRYTNLNTGIAAIAGLIPGTFGMLVSLPEMISIIRNQLAMTYDLAYHHNKSHLITREVLVTVLLNYSNDQNLTFVKQHGTQVIIERTNEKLWDSILKHLSILMLQRVGRSFICKWVPVLGSGALAIWTYISTQRMGKYAQGFFEHEIAVPDYSDLESNYDHTPEPSYSENRPHQPTSDRNYQPQNNLPKILEPQAHALAEAHIKVLINLSKADRNVAHPEKIYIREIIDKTAFASDTKTELHALLDTAEPSEVNLTLIKLNSDEALGLLVDMVTLAKKDGQLNIAEKFFIYDTALKLGFTQNEVDGLL